MNINSYISIYMLSCTISMMAITSFYKGDYGKDEYFLTFIPLINSIF